MLTSGELAGMRTTVASALPDTASITRRAAGTVDVDGSYVADVGMVMWTGACRVNPKPGVTREVQIGDAHAITSWYVATLPYDATGFGVDDYLVVTASSFSTDLIGKPLRIVEIELMTWEVGRRLTLHAEDAGEGMG